MFSLARVFILVSLIASLPSAAIAAENGKAARTDLYGDPLPPGAVARLGSVRFQHDNSPIDALAFSPDSKIVASVNGNEVVLWDRATGKELRQYLIGWFSKVALSFDTDGKVQVLGVNFRKPFKAVILHPESKDKPLQLTLGEAYTWEDAFTLSADGKRLFAAGGKEMAVWDTATGKQLIRLPKNQPAIAASAFAPDYRKAACVIDGGQAIEVVDLGTDRLLYKLEASPGERFTGVVFSHDGKYLFSAAGGGVHVWNASTGKEARRLKKEDYSWLRGLAVSPDGKTLATSARFDTAVKIWDAATGKRLLPPGTECDHVESLAYTDPKTLVTINSAGVARFWDAYSGKCQRRVGPEQGFRGIVARSPRGDRLAGWTKASLLRVWDVAEGKMHWQGKVPFTELEYLAFSSDGKMLIGQESKENQMRVVCWDTDTGTVSYPLPAGSHDWLHISLDGTTVALEATKKLQLFRLRPQRRWRRLGIPVVLQNRSFHGLSQDGRTLLLRDSKGFLSLIEAASGSQLGCFTVPADKKASGIAGVAFSPNGLLLATAHLDGTVRLWDVATQKELERFAGTPDWTSRVAISPDGRTVASDGLGHTVLVWKRRVFLPHERRTQPSHGELEANWTKLAEVDAAAAQQAVRALAAFPSQSVPFLDKRLPPASNGDARQLRQWVAELDSDSYTVRQKASQELKKEGDRAEDALEEALDGKPSLELRRRVLELLEKQENARCKCSSDNLRTIRAVQVFEAIGTPEAQRVLTKLSEGAAGALRTQEARTALRRLGRNAEK